MSLKAHLTTSGDIFGGSYRHLVDRGQKCHLTIYNVQDYLPQQRDPDLEKKVSPNSIYTVDHKIKRNKNNIESSDCEVPVQDSDGGKILHSPPPTDTLSLQLDVGQFLLK